MTYIQIYTILNTTSLVVFKHASDKKAKKDHPVSEYGFHHISGDKPQNGESNINSRLLQELSCYGNRI
jgi:hypothetical protein